MKVKFFNNYRTIFSLRLLKNVVDTFIDTFLVMYFLDVSSENIIPLGIYQLILVITVYATIYFCKNLSKTKHRITLLRIGIILDLVYFLAIILLKNKVAEYAFFIGFLRGLEEGFYYSVYNTIESDGVKNKERTKFIGTYTMSRSILAIVFPIFFGGLIAATGFIESTAIASSIIAVRILLSFVYRDINLPRTPKANMKKFQLAIKGDRRFKIMYREKFFDGLTSSSSMFSSIITIYVIKIFSNSFSLGIFTAIFSIISGLLGACFAKFLKKKHYTGFMSVSAVLTIISLLFMIFDNSALAVIAFKFFRVISKDGTHLITETYTSNLCNSEKIKREYKTEYWLTNEKWLVLGRSLSCLLFMAMAFMESWTPIMLLFTFLLAMFHLASIQFHRAMQKRGRQNLGFFNRFIPAYRIITKK